MTDVVIGIIAGSVVALISFILGLLGNMWYANIQDKKQRQKEAMKNHFIQLSENVITPLIIQLQSLKNDLGEISPDGKGRHWGPDDADVSLKFEDWKIFSSHFEKFAEMVQEIIKNINTHNEEFDNYITLLTKKLNSVHPLHSSFITPSIFSGELLRLLERTISQVAENIYEKTSYPITHDFSKAIIIQESENWILTNGYGNHRIVYAILKSEEDCIICKEKLIDLQSSQELQKNAYDLNNNANILMTTCNNISGVLEILRHSYEKLGKTLKKVEDCYYCQIIFDIS